MIGLICNSLPSTLMIIRVVLAILTMNKDENRFRNSMSWDVNQRFDWASEILDTVDSLLLISQYIVLSVAYLL